MRNAPYVHPRLDSIRVQCMALGGRKIKTQTSRDKNMNTHKQEGIQYLVKQSPLINSKIKPNVIHVYD